MFSWQRRGKHRAPVAKVNRAERLMQEQRLERTKQQLRQQHPRQPRQQVRRLLEKALRKISSRKSSV